MANVQEENITTDDRITSRYRIRKGVDDKCTVGRLDRKR